MKPNKFLEPASIFIFAVWIMGVLVIGSASKPKQTHCAYNQYNRRYECCTDWVDTVYGRACKANAELKFLYIDPNGNRT